LSCLETNTVSIQHSLYLVIFIHKVHTYIFNATGELQLQWCSCSAVTLSRNYLLLNHHAHIYEIMT